MSRIAKNDVFSAVDRVAKTIKTAAGPDGVTSRADIKTKLDTLQGTEKALTDTMFRFIDNRDAAPNARITAPDVDRAVVYIREKLIAAYDLNDNGLSKTEVTKMSRTGQLAVRLAAELKGVAPIVPSPVAGELSALFTKAAENTYYVSESDSQPSFISASLAAGKPVTGDAVFAAFSKELKAAFGEYDGPFALKDFTFELQDVHFLGELGSVDATGDDYDQDNARGFGRIKSVFDANVTEVVHIKVGPRDSDDSTQMAQDNGAYQHLIVGRGPDGKLAGVMFEAVET